MQWNRLKLITFDATNTLLQFRQPPGIHYLRTAQKILPTSLISHVTEEQVITRFRDHYSTMSAQHPNFGKTSILWQEWWRLVVRGTFSSLLDNAEGRVNQVAEQLIRDYATDTCWCVTTGGVELLKRLRNVKPSITIGVISNFDPRLENILKSVKVRDHFDFVLTSYDAGFSKPDVRIFDEALRRSGRDEISPTDALHIGDNVDLDYGGATSAGWNALLYNPKMNHKNINNVKSDHIFNEFSSLRVG